MRSLVIRLVIFLLPAAATLVFPAWVLFASGESEPDEVFLDLRRQSRPFLVGRAYSDAMGYLKLKTVQVEAPPIVALGTSRVMPFRQDFFGTRFFNAGSGEYRQFDDLLAFLRQIPAGGEPKLIVLGLDQKFFNARWTSRISEPFARQQLKENRMRWWSLLRASWPSVYRDYLMGKFRIADLVRPQPDGVRRIGLTAAVRNSGYREDGSFTWDFWEFDAEDLKQIARDESYYVYGTSVSDRAIEDVKMFLAECRQRDIYVAGFLPPFSPRVYHALEQHREQYAFMFQLAGRLQPLFDRFGFSFADFTNPARCEIRRDGFFDGQHASENGYRRLWTCWTEADARLQAFRPRGSGRPTQ